MMDSYENPTDTVHQLAERDQGWGATHPAWAYSIQFSIQVWEYHVLVEYFLN